MKELNIVNKNIKDLKPYERNPRHNDEAVPFVVESIKEFGFKVPLVVDKDNVIVCGHTRYKAAKQLKLKELPCIIADDLTEEQINKFRYADNKVSEKAEWDFDILQEDLETFFDEDMIRFGFDESLFEDIEEDDEEEKQNERERTMNAYNLDEYDTYSTEGYYEMPTLEPCSYIPTKIIGFNYALTSTDYEAGIHFFIDDYQFERVWNQPETYLEKLEKFDCILTPDFSLYTEMPIAMKIWNIYRSRLIGQIAQRRGMKVIPTVSWCEDKTFQFCFDGLPKRSTLAISTIGVKRESENFKIWKDGVDEMIRQKEPRTIICYGGKVDYDFGNIKVVYIDNTNTERMKGN